METGLDLIMLALNIDQGKNVFSKNIGVTIGPRRREKGKGLWETNKSTRIGERYFVRAAFSLSFNILGRDKEILAWI